MGVKDDTKAPLGGALASACAAVWVEGRWQVPRRLSPCWGFVVAVRRTTGAWWLLESRLESLV